MNTFALDSLVYSPEEHPKAVGTIMRILDTGYVIEFRTPPSNKLPYGHIITEFWSFQDAQALIAFRKPDNSQK